MKYWIGVDVGSTTTKTVILRSGDEQIVFSRYIRHHAELQKSVCALLKEGKDSIPAGSEVMIAFTGSGSKPLADAAGVPFVQEVVANSLAVMKYYPQARTAIELGGQDAKVIFFRQNTATGRLEVSDMRMNGSCAGGTGAFIDEIASLLKVAPEEYEALAENGTQLYDISGRCGVYAKTDIQPLLNQGVRKEDIALSALHAISKQTIGGLAQGLDIRKPVVFEGGPLNFNPALVRVFAERLELHEDEILIPPHPEVIVAYGAALSVPLLFETGGNRMPARRARELAAELDSRRAEIRTGSTEAPVFFKDDAEREDFFARHPHNELKRAEPKPGDHFRAFLGMDSGSTTTKFVLLGEDGELLDSFYAPNAGEPLMVAKEALIAMRQRYRDAGAELEILAAGSTGYGELLFHKAFGTECHFVETVAHARAAEQYVKDATFLLDIGGQDMKAIWLDHGIITNIVVNEACSSG